MVLASSAVTGSARDLTASIQPQKDVAAEAARISFTLRRNWARRRMWAPVVQGAIVAGIIFLIVEPLSGFNIDSYLSPSKLIAGGGP
jgi:hypothetical protein